MVNNKLLMVNSLPEMPKYETYKDSGVEWLGEIPEGWYSIKLKYLCLINKESLPENSKAELEFEYVDIGNVSFENGIGVVQTFSFKDSPSRARRLAKEGDTIISTVRTYLKAIDYVDKSKMNYVFSTGFAVLEPKNNFYSLYLTAFVKSNAFTNQVDEASSGISYPAINSTQLSNLFIAMPPLKEQTAIANFLDQKTSQIDQAIAIKEKQISLLKERKQILIQQAVTRGLNPNAPMRDSGVEWIGEIPEHWEVKRLKYVLIERNERSKTGVEPLFMVSQIHGLVVRAEYHKKAEVAQSNIDNKIVYTNDLVFNKLKAHLGVFFKSNIKFKGLVSPDYAVYRSNALIEDLKFLEYLFRHPAYISQFVIRARGIVEGLIRLYTNDLFDISIPIPEKSEQEGILSYIEVQSNQINKAITLQNQQIEKLKEYKTTLINSAVTGKIKILSEELV